MSRQLCLKDTAAETAPALEEKARMIRQAELEKAFRRLGRLSPADREAVVALAEALTNRILGGPIHLLHVDATGAYEAVLRDLFVLDEGVNSMLGVGQPVQAGLSVAAC